MVNTNYVERQNQREDSNAATQSTRYKTSWKSQSTDLYNKRAENTSSVGVASGLRLFDEHVENDHEGERVEPFIDEESELLGCPCGKFVLNFGQKDSVTSQSPINQNYNGTPSTRYEVSFNNGEGNYNAQSKTYALAA